MYRARHLGAPRTRQGRRTSAVGRGAECGATEALAWLAFVAETAVDCARATLDFSTLDRTPFLHVDCFYVCKAWRSRAIVRRLWQLARDHAVQLRFRPRQWQTPDWNEAAIRFCRRLGATARAKQRFTPDLGAGPAAAP